MDNINIEYNQRDMTRTSINRNELSPGPSPECCFALKVMGKEDNDKQIFTKFVFPFKLHCMLTDSVKEGNEAIVSWLPNGKAFRVHKTGEFVSQILPKYFKKIKFRSFQRQLHAYGFQRIKDRYSENKGGYAHDYFVRGKEYLSHEMSRGKSRESKIRSAILYESDIDDSTRTQRRLEASDEDNDLDSLLDRRSSPVQSSSSVYPLSSSLIPNGVVPTSMTTATPCRIPPDIRNEIIKTFFKGGDLFSLKSY